MRRAVDNMNIESIEMKIIELTKIKQQLHDKVDVNRKVVVERKFN